MSVGHSSLQNKGFVLDSWIQVGLPEDNSSFSVIQAWEVGSYARMIRSIWYESNDEISFLTPVIRSFKLKHKSKPKTISLTWEIQGHVLNWMGKLWTKTLRKKSHFSFCFTHGNSHRSNSFYLNKSWQASNWNQQRWSMNYGSVQVMKVLCIVLL